MSENVNVTEENTGVRKLQSIVIKENLFALTEKHFDAALLNNLIFWNGIVENMDMNLKNQIRQMEARKAKPHLIERKKQEIRNGWFYKTGEEILTEMMGWGSASTITRTIDNFVKRGWMEKGNNPDPKKKWDRTKWYRVNVVQIVKELHELGYALDGYSLYKEVPNSGISGDENPPKDAPNGSEIEPNEPTKADEPAPLPIFHGEKCIFHGETSIFHGERTIPEGLQQKGISLFKRDDDEEKAKRVSRVELSSTDVEAIERSLQLEFSEMNPRSFISVCRKVRRKHEKNGVKVDYEEYLRTCLENKVIELAERKKKDEERKKEEQSKQKSPRSRSGRKEMLPKWLEQKDEEYISPQENQTDVEEQRRKLEEALKKYA